MVVAQLEERSLPTTEVRSSNPVIGKFYMYLQSVNYTEKWKINSKKMPRWTIFRDNSRRWKANNCSNISLEKRAKWVQENSFWKVVLSERKILNHISSQLEIPTTPLEIDRYLLVRLIDTIDTHRFRRSSVTRFGEILPIWQNFTNIWQIFDCSFPVWQYTDPTLAKLWHYWASFHCCKLPNIE